MKDRLLSAVVISLTVTTACGGASTSSPRPAAPAALAEPRAEEDPVVWLSPHDRDHPLAGRIWDVSLQRWIGEERLDEELRQATFILLGERHDNLDHHRLRRALLDGLLRSGRRPALVLEMLDTDQQGPLEEARARGADADGMADAVGWEQGWGSWELYRPFVALALSVDVPLLAGNLPRERVRQVARQGPTVLGEELLLRLGLDQPLEAEAHRAMAQELVAAHCGMLPEHAAVAMVPAQRARDAHLAIRLVDGATGDGAVLLAGNGHVRVDWGSGAIVRRLRPDAPILAVGFVEVESGLDEPGAYASRYVAERLPFDVVWFTPGADREDPCQELRSRMRGHGSTE